MDMLNIASKSRQAEGKKAKFDVEIASVATAVPKHKICQAEISKRATEIFPHHPRLKSLYGNTGIDNRYLCEPPDWYHRRHGWEARTLLFQRHALDLLEEVALKATETASIKLDDVGALIVNTITGLAIPSLDAKLMNRLRLPRSVERLPIFGLGCGGGVGGLARAARYAQAMPAGSHVLFLTIDLCSLCLRTADPCVAMFVAAALFGDGAAGVVLRNTHGTGGGAERGTVLAIGDHFWPNTETIMGWDIKDDGFGVVLSPELPELIRAEFMPALTDFLDANRMDLGEFTGFIMHPGGAKILKTIQKLLRLSRDDLAYSWDVLRDFGNMSSPTALFGLATAIHAGARGPHLLTAFGPGFSAYFVAVDL
jgi:alkylresorcinol/alkylpyrone synthase